MRPSDLDPTVQIRRVLDVCGARRRRRRKGRHGGLPAVNDDSVACRRVGGVVVQLVVVLAALGHIAVASFRGICVTGVVGASLLSSPRCGSAR
jgi:hypothetical protein